MICTKTIMDNSDPDIIFDDKGISNHYYEYNRIDKLLPKGDEKKKRLKNIIDEIKENGKGKQYDCLLGLSGGVDSSYIAYLVGEMKLRALVVHFDNGWNSEMAVNNIHKIVKKYNFDLHTLVVDWDEFKDIQLSFFRASVPNIEIVTDHAIIATLYRIADEYNIKYLLSGSNHVTEGILPKAWGYDASDFYHIKSIHKIFGSKKIKTYPSLSLWNFFYYMIFKKIKKITLLNFIDYKKEDAIKTLNEKIAWEYYGGKHFESIFTQFFQAYVLPKKFGFDKRKAHLSTLICSGQITREQALEEMKKPLYDQEQLDQHIEYVLKKFEISREEFDRIMMLPPKKHTSYPTNSKWIELGLKIKRKLTFK